MSPFFETITTIALAIVTLAIISTLVSRKAQTPQVIQSAGAAFGNSMAVAEAPVTGSSLMPVLSYPGTDFSGSFGYGS